MHSAQENRPKLRKKRLWFPEKRRMLKCVRHIRSARWERCSKKIDQWAEEAKTDIIKIGVKAIFVNPGPANEDKQTWEDADRSRTAIGLKHGTHLENQSAWARIGIVQFQKSFEEQSEHQQLDTVVQKSRRGKGSYDLEHEDRARVWDTKIQGSDLRIEEGVIKASIRR